MISSKEIVEFIKSRHQGVSINDLAVEFKGTATPENLLWARGALARVQRLSVEGKVDTIIGCVGGKYKELFTIGDYETVLIRRAKDAKTRTENTLIIRKHFVVAKGGQNLDSDRLSVLDKLDEVLAIK